MGELSVSRRRWGKVFVGRRGRPNAPGPDRVAGKVWIGRSYRWRMLEAALHKTSSNHGKRAFVFLKESKPVENLSTYRPICLLDDVGKLFERTNRVVRHESEPVLWSTLRSRDIDH